MNYLLLLLLPLGAQAYDLFHPVPRDQMRDFDSDRPGFTDSPHTVDAGHLQIETGIFSYTLTRSPGSETEAYAANSLSLGVGALDFLEVQAAFDSYDWQIVRSVGQPSVSSGGFGDLLLRTKFSLVGNSGGGEALGVIPKVKVPTSSIGNHRAEMGVSIPATVSLNESYTLGLMPEWDRRLNGDGGCYHEELLAAVVFSGKISDQMGGYVQYQSISSSEEGVPRNASAGFGITLALAKYLQIDAGVNFGLTVVAADRNASLGLETRY